MDQKAVTDLVERELAGIRDCALVDLIKHLRVGPYPVDRDWDYDSPDQRYTCWTVLEHKPSNTGVAYCDAGFGPGHPWGLVFLSGQHMSIGMDSAWFAHLESAVREGPAWGGSNPPGYEVD